MQPPRIGQTARRTRTVTARDIELFTELTGDRNPLHYDEELATRSRFGALIVQGGRLTAAGCVLPLTSNPGVSRTLGTRHRAAIGLTEETDAVVLVVSEEDGTVSLVHQGRMTRDVDPGTLRVTLQRLLLG